MNSIFHRKNKLGELRILDAIQPNPAGLHVILKPGALDLVAPGQWPPLLIIIAQ